MSIADTFMGRSKREPFVSKHIYVEAMLNRKLKAMAKAKEMTQQELINGILEEAADKWQREDASNVFVLGDKDAR